MRRGQPTAVRKPMPALNRGVGAACAHAAAELFPFSRFIEKFEDLSKTMLGLWGTRETRLSVSYNCHISATQVLIWAFGSPGGN